MWQFWMCSDTVFWNWDFIGMPFLCSIIFLLYNVNYRIGFLLGLCGGMCSINIYELKIKNHFVTLCACNVPMNCGSNGTSLSFKEWRVRLWVQYPQGLCNLPLTNLMCLECGIVFICKLHMRLMSHIMCLECDILNNWRFRETVGFVYIWWH